MPKTLLFVLAFTLLLCSTMNAQSAERTVLANAGTGVSIASGFYISWTLGEAFVATRSSAAAPVLYITEGFQQPNSGTVPTVDAAGQITVSPNPAGDALNIAVGTARCLIWHSVMRPINKSC